MTRFFSQAFVIAISFAILALMFLLWGLRQWTIHNLWTAMEREDLGYIQYYAKRGRD
jgi:hypothetical protein